MTGSGAKPFIALEGSDGSGKGTHFALTLAYLTREGIEYQAEDFPQYEKASSAMVRLYLNGELGSLDEIGPELASTFYAIDRAFAAERIKEAQKLGKLVLTNRFFGSNLGHQGSKIDDLETRREFYRWAQDLEFNRLGVPRPDLNIVFLVPAEIAQARVDMKETRSYTSKKRDLHEADINHLRRTVAVYEELCELFPDLFVPIEGVHNGKELPPEEIQKLVIAKIEEVL
ncbi:MAG TPA: hypothetical protein VF996_02445 [Candidatus Saccharimonadales bacterium]|jgi:dTMP kinase